MVIFEVFSTIGVQWFVETGYTKLGIPTKNVETRAVTTFPISMVDGAIM